MHGGHARFSFKPLSVPASPPPNSAPAFEPPSPLSDISSSPPLNTPVQGARTRLASGSAGRPSQRRRDASEHTTPPPTAACTIRRIRPLACMTSNTNPISVVPKVNVQCPGKEKAWKADWRSSGVQQQQPVQEATDFPPKHVVLHPDDANNKVFLALGRALMSVDNRAMTIKDLAELSMRYGIACQNASAASQAITFFIRSHLTRCEEEQDFPLLLRHVLSGTQRDDALAPALYSRTGGNVSNKDKTARDENGNLKERVTCFRRGTTVWYLSRAAGAPCPFARAGIALRDFAETSAITSVEGRKGDCDSSRGIKRKRERTLRKRAGSGPAARCDDSDDSDEERKPPKIKLTLRLRPCLTSMREKPEAEEESSTSSESDSDAREEIMEVDNSERPVAPPHLESTARKREPTWIFPPFPIQRRISIPPYTPSEETYPTVYTSPTTNQFTSTFAEWHAITKPKLELACVDSPRPGLGHYYRRERASSVSFSVASPPPESDEELGVDDDDDDFSISMSPEIRFKREDDFAYVWPQAAPSTSSVDLCHIKSEPDVTDHDAVGSSKRSSLQTIKQEKSDELDLDLGSLSISFDEGSSMFDFGASIKQDDLAALNTGFSWGQPVDLTHDEHVEVICDTEEDVALRKLWKDVELLGPDTVRLQDLEDGSWEEESGHDDTVASPSSAGHLETSHGSLAQNAEQVSSPQSPDLTFSVSTAPPPSSPAFTLESLSPPPSLAGSVHAWSACSPETEIESVGPASPPSFSASESFAIVCGDGPSPLSGPDNYAIERSSPWVIPGKQASSSLAYSRQSMAVRSDDLPGIPLSEQSAPWERGMCTEEDVERHLLEPTHSLSMMSMNLSPHSLTPLEGFVSEPPLSPQEEAVFQSFCMFPDTSREPRDATKSPKKERETTNAEVPVCLPDSTFANVLAAATRPSMRLRERRPSKRIAESERMRKQTDLSRAKADVENDDPISNSDHDDHSDANLTLRKRETSGTSVHSTCKDSNKAQPRRSKRVANAAVTQRNRERLRKRTVT